MGLENILSSDTAGAVMEAVLNGIQAVTVSLAREGLGDEREYRLAVRTVAKISWIVISEELGGGSRKALININVPPNA